MFNYIFSHGIGHFLAVIFSIITLAYALKMSKALSGGIFGEVCKRLAVIAALFSLLQILILLVEGAQLESFEEFEVYVSLILSGVFCWTLYDLGKMLKKQLS